MAIPVPLALTGTFRAGADIMSCEADCGAAAELGWRVL